MIVHLADCSPEVIHLLRHWCCWPEMELLLALRRGRIELVHEWSPVSVVLVGSSWRAHRLVWRRSKARISGGVDEGLMLVEREVVRRWRDGTAGVRRSHWMLVEIRRVYETLDSLKNNVRVLKNFSMNFTWWIC